MSKGSKNSGPVSFVWAGKSENTEKFMLAVRLWVLRNWPKSPPSRPSNSCKPPSWLKRGLVCMSANMLVFPVSHAQASAL
eukprot:scaffold76334_cov17-Tisochrysis_lutea.AAC.1